MHTLTEHTLLLLALLCQPALLLALLPPQPTLLPLCQPALLLLQPELVLLAPLLAQATQLPLALLLPQPTLLPQHALLVLQLLAGTALPLVLCKGLVHSCCHGCCYGTALGTTGLPRCQLVARLMARLGPPCLLRLWDAEGEVGACVCNGKRLSQVAGHDGRARRAM